MRTHDHPLRTFLFCAACLSASAVSAATVTWDTSATAGFQSGNGTWGVDAFWSTDGATLAGWTAGDSALFLGGATKVTETITLSGAQSIGGLSFGSATTSGAWTFGGAGTMNLAAASIIDVSTGSSANLADRVVTGGFNINKTGAGTLRMNSGTVANLAKVTVDAGILELVGTGLEASGLGSTYTVNNGATLAVKSGNLWTAGNSAAVTLNSGSTMTANGFFFRLTNATFNGGSLDLNGFTGTTDSFKSAQIYGGFSVNQNSRIFASSGVGQLRVGAGALAMNVASGATMTIDVNLATGGGGAITKSGLGQLTLNGSSVHTDQVILNAGTLTLGHGQALGTGSLALNAGTLNLASVTVTNAMAFKAGAINVGTGQSATWNGVISTASSGTAALSKTGNGQLTLGGANTYTTGTSLSAGTLVLANNAALGTGAVTISGGVLDLGGRTISNNVTVNGGSLIGGTIDLAQTTISDGTVSANLAGTQGYTKVGGSTVTLSGNNTYAGNTAVNAGTLTAGSNNAFSTGTVTVNLGATLGVASGVTVANNLTLSGGAFFTANGGTLSGTLSGSGSMTKVGSGTLTLSGNSTFTGGTIVQEGSLRVDGVMDGTVTVNVGAKLAGTGTIADSTTVLTGGSIGAGGVGVGTLNLAALELRNGSTLELKIADGNGPAGVGFDRLLVAGPLDLSSASLGTSPVDRITLRLAGLPVNFDPSANLSFTFLDYGSLNLGSANNITDLFTINVDNLFDQNGQALSSGSFSLVNDTASKQLSVAYTSPIPEPSTYGLSLGALGLGIAMVRRRRRKS